MKTTDWRFLVSTGLMLLTILVGGTGILLYLAPSGPGVVIMGLPKEKLTNLHTVTGFVMLGFIAIHLFLNFKMYLGEMRIFTRR